MKVGFIGLGKMGSGMARNLLRAGHEVIVYNRTRDKALGLAAEGARIAGSPSEACRSREAVLTVLADDPAVEQVVFGKNGVASGLKKGGIHISISTISTALARRLAAKHGEKGQGYLSVPGFGRPEAAENKKLVVVGGRRGRTHRALPAFIQRDRTPDIRCGTRAVAGQCRQAVRKFHDRLHDRDVRGSFCYAAEGRRRSSHVPGDNERAVRFSCVRELRRYYCGRTL